MYYNDLSLDKQPLLLNIALEAGLDHIKNIECRVFDIESQSVLKHTMKNK